MSEENPPIHMEGEEMSASTLKHTSSQITCEEAINDDKKTFLGEHNL